MFTLLAGVRVISANTTMALLLVSVSDLEDVDKSQQTLLSTFLRPRPGDVTPRAYLESISIFELVELNISNMSESCCAQQTGTHML